MSFIKLKPVGRIQGYVGLEAGVGYKLNPFYQHLEVGAKPVLTEKGNPRKVIKAGEVVLIEAAGTIHPKRCQVDVVVNGELATLGQVSYQSRVAESSVPVPVVVRFVPDSDMDLNKLLSDTWFIRLYALD